MMVNTPCIVCNQKGASHKLMKLKNLLAYLSARVKSTPKTTRITWDISEKCRYGLHCPELSRVEMESRNLTEEINGYLLSVIENRDSGAYHSALDFLRGDFPRTYRQLEMLWATEVKDNG